MVSQNIYIFSSLIFAVGCYSAVLSTKYGIPHKPFDTYGPPEQSEKLDLVRSPVTGPESNIKIEFKTPFEGTKVDSPTRTVTGGKSGDLKVPPNTQLVLRDGRNQYSQGFQSPDGTEVKEQGRLISTDDGWEYVVAKTGSYKYKSPEGIDVAVEWIADEKGFRILSSTV